MGIGGGGFPKTPFPATVPEFKVALPLPVPGRTETFTELTCNFTKAEERGYTKDWHQMYAASYMGVSELGVMPFALVVNAHTGTNEGPGVVKVSTMVAMVAVAVAKAYALNWAYTQQRPPLPVPDNPGVGAPLSRACLETQDGTIRLRGVCGALRSLAPELVSSVNVGFAPLWGKESPPS